MALETDKSRSYSTSSALMKTERLNSFELTYQYINQTKPDAVSSMENHYGTTWLTINEDDDLVEGENCTGRGRQQFGKIKLCQKQ